MAYRQFCEHFLAPLALMAHRDVRLAALLRDRPRRGPARPRQRPAAVADAAELRPAVAPPPPRPRAAPLRRRRGRRQGGPQRRGSAAPRLIGLIGNLRGTVARPVAGSRPAPSGRTTPTTRATTTRATAGQGAPRRDVRAARPRDARAGTWAPTPVATAGSRPMPASGSSPSTSTRRPRSATTARSGREARRHPAAHPRRREPEPRHRLGGRRASLAARAGRSGRRARAGPGPPPRDLAQRAAADGARTCFADLAPWAIVEFVPKEDPMVRPPAGDRARTSSRTTRSRASGPRAGERFEVVAESADRGQPAGPVPAAPPLRRARPGARALRPGLPAQCGPGMRSVTSVRPYGRSQLVDV